MGKKYRLRLRNDIKNVLTTGVYFKNNFFALRIVKNNLPVSRFGIFVGKKISKSAVIRNKIKRRMRSIIRNNIGNISVGYDIAIFSFLPAKNADFKQLEDYLILLFKQSNLIK